MSLRELGWPTLAALVLALICAVIAVGYDAPEGGYHFWPLVTGSLLVLGYAAWTTRRWWLLLLIPVMLSPMASLLLLAVACFMGNCI